MNLDMKWDDYRRHGTKTAAALWATGDASLLIKNFHDNAWDVSNALEDPIDLVCGALFLIGAYFTAKESPKNVTIGMAIATLGYGLLLCSAAYQGKVNSALGASAGFVSCAWAGVNSFKRMTSKKEESKKQFQENKKSIFEEYPLMKPMVINFVSNVAFVVGNLADQEFIYAGIGILWALGAACMGLSKQEDNTEINKNNGSPSLQ